MQRSYLIPELLREVGGLVQRETGHQRRGEDMLAAQLVDNIRHIEVRVILQQLSATKTATTELKDTPEKTAEDYPGTKKNTDFIN